MAVHDINNRPDILHGYKLHVEIKDSKVITFSVGHRCSHFDNKSNQHADLVCDRAKLSFQ